jgi:hypothetical protein
VVWIAAARPAACRRPVAERGKSMDQFLPDEYATMTASLCLHASILHLLF